MDNPIAYHRKVRHISRRGMAELAVEAGSRITISAIQQVEDGMFANIPQVIHAVLENYPGPTYVPQVINEEYAEYIAWKRSCIKYDGIPFKLKPMTHGMLAVLKKHPLQEYLDYSEVIPTQFSQHACVPKSSLFRYLKGEQRTMPQSVYRALKECGVPIRDITELDTRGKDYYDIKHGRGVKQ